MTKSNTLFPLNRFEEISKHPENFKLIERIPLTIEGVDTHFPIELNKRLPDDQIHSVVFLDTETTGLDQLKDKIIELGMVKATYSKNRNILLSVDRFYDEFEDPKIPIPEKITELTGISDDMVRDHLFDDASVANFLSGNPLIIAHNASFDRPFFDKRFPTLSNCNWADSLTEIPWKDLGFGGSKLEFLNASIGYFYDAHRAYVDCLALLWLMYQVKESFTALLNNARSVSYTAYVIGNTFSFKDKLKGEHSFRFTTLDNGIKCWCRDFRNKAEAEKVKKVLLETYCDGSTNFDVDIREFTPKTRFKKNI